MEIIGLGQNERYYGTNVQEIELLAKEDKKIFAIASAIYQENKDSGIIVVFNKYAEYREEIEDYFKKNVKDSKWKVIEY